jgi:hypothetical protein
MCLRCGTERVPLELHHVDHDETNNSLGNLALLCRTCHAKVGKRR